MIRLALAAVALSIFGTTPSAGPRLHPVVALVDSGVRVIPSLRGKVLPGVDLVDGVGTGTSDLNGHGTVMASIIARGCPACLLLPVKVLAATGRGDGATLAQGIAYAAAHGAQVINVSITSQDDEPDVDDAIRAATAQGIDVVVAAGNVGTTPQWPAAAAAGAITVAGVTASGAAYPWSGVGPLVTIGAPGYVKALGATNAPMWAQGTSPAAAVVSGRLGALLANPGVTAADARAALLNGSPRDPGLDVQCGCRVP